MKNCTFYGLLGLLLFVANGCSTAPSADYDKLNLVDVSGTITLDGEPLEDAVVIFEDPTTSQFSYGLTDSSGSYSLQLDSDMDGVVPGQKIVRVSTTRKVLGLNSDEEGGTEEGGEESEAGVAAAPAHERIPDKFNNKSELQANVSASETTFDFDLTSK